MKTSPEEIVSRFKQRRDAMTAVNTKRREVRDAYNGDLSILLPDMGRNEQASVANLVNTGLDQLAMRVASTLPSIECPPRDPLVKRELRQAQVRRQALLGWWQENNLKLMQRRRARQLLGYASSPVVIRPNFTTGLPQWHIRNAMGAFPSTCTNPDDMVPDDAIFAFTRTWGWLAKHPQYREQASTLLRKEQIRSGDKVTLLEYIDDEQITLLVVSDALDGEQGYPVTGSTPGFTGGKKFDVLESVPNKAGTCTAVVPGRINLDRAMGQFDGVLGMYASMARLMALEVIAVEKGVFPDTYLESRPGEQAKFISGPHDGRSGLVNIIQGGTIREQQTNPGFQTNPTIDRLERAIRLSGGIPAEFGGESASNVRTGRRGENVLSATVDFPIQEQQEILAASLQEENKKAIAVAKGYFGGQPKAFYVNWKGARGHVDYVPNEVFTTDHNIVEFSHAGADLNGLTIMGGQLVGMGALSKQGFMDMHPLISDAELERDRMTKEELESALRAAVAQKLNAGEIAPVDGAWLMKQVLSDKMELVDAVIALDKRVQQRQASSGPPGAPDGPVMPGSPEAMAGLAAGTPAEGQAAPPTIEGPNPSQQGLAGLLSALRSPQRTLPSERPAVA